VWSGLLPQAQYVFPDEVQMNSCITIRETEDGMMWHLEIASDDFQLKVANLEATRHKWLQNKSLDYL
jgi:hypothetical protein